jgi:hypothetical protein
MWNFLALLTMAAAGVFLIWFGRLYQKVGSYQKERDQQLDSEGIDTDAEITEKIYSPKNLISYYYLRYQYTATLPDGQSQQLTTTEPVSSGDYNRLKAGDHVTVRYMPGAPTIVRLGSGVRASSSAGMIRFSFIILMAIGVALILGGIAVFITATISDNERAAQSTAQTLRRSATPNVAEKTATVQAAAATAGTDQAMAAQIRSGLASRIPEWKKVNDRVMHRLRPPDTGLRNIVEIDYGYCDQGSFYVYAWTQVTYRLDMGKYVENFVDGYGYVEGSTPPNCYPKELAQVWLRNSGSLGNDWYAVSGAIDVYKTDAR